MQKNIAGKIRFPVLICIFVMTVSVSSLFKNTPNNDVLAKNVYKIESEKMIKKEKSNINKCKEKDSYNKAKKLGMGEVVLNKIKKQDSLN